MEATMRNNVDVGSAGLENAHRSRLVWGIWLYIFLLIFEGALRKWVLPGLSGPLLIVRDPVAIVLMIYAWYYGYFPNVTYNWWLFVITAFAFFTTIFFGHGNLGVALYGARILLIHFPFIFLMGSVLRRDDVVKVGEFIIWISIPLAILVGLQFFSPQSALVNRGIGGDLTGGGFSGAMGYFRPTATFSFTNGTTLFFGLVAAFLTYFWLNPERISKLALIAASVGLVTCIPLSISRGLLFSVGVTVLFLIVAVSRKPKYLLRVAVGGIGLLALLFLLGNWSIFSTATEVFTRRFEVAAVSEGGIENTLIDRYLGGLISAISEAGQFPFFGLGLGMGTNAGSALLGSGRTFLISEGEWGRLVGEMGALLGIAIIGLRLIISTRLAIGSFGAMRLGDMLPWLLLSSALLVFPQGQWAQPTTLGFSTVIMGLLIASLQPSPLPNAPIA